MAEELKACPFCGGKAETVQFTRKRWTVECFADGCGAGIISQGDMQTAIAAWNTRAQLPSQGGEAVAWQTVCSSERRFSVNKCSADERAERWLEQGKTGVIVEPLYTHPADQVADDLTMVKVSRELLQDLRDLAFDQVEHHRAAMGAYKQTRQSAMDSVLAQADALLRS